MIFVDQLRFLGSSTRGNTSTASKPPAKVLCRDKFPP